MITKHVLLITCMSHEALCNRIIFSSREYDYAGNQTIIKEILAKCWLLR